MAPATRMCCHLSEIPVLLQLSDLFLLARERHETAPSLSVRFRDLWKRSEPLISLRLLVALGHLLTIHGNASQARLRYRWELLRTSRRCCLYVLHLRLVPLSRTADKDCCFWLSSSHALLYGSFASSGGRHLKMSP